MPLPLHDRSDTHPDRARAARDDSGDGGGGLMRLRETIRFEVAYQVRRPATWLYVAVLASFVHLIAGEAISDGREGGTPVNAAFALASYTLYGCLAALLPIAALAGEAGARDVQTRMTPLLYTTPVSRATYLGGRFLGALLLAAVVTAMVPLAMLVKVAGSDATVAVLGVMRPAHYLAAYLLVALPAALVASAFAFVAATLARRQSIAFVAVGLLLAASVLCVLVLANNFGQWTLASLLDPLGLTTMFEMVQGWTPARKRTDFPQLTAAFLRNRALWLALAAGALALTHRRFRLTHHVEGSARRRRASRSEAAEVAAAPIVAPRARRTFGAGTGARQLAAVVVESYRAVVLGGGGVVMLALAGLVFGVGPEVMQVRNVPLLPTTAGLAMTLGSWGMWPALLTALLITFYAGELVWRDRDVGLGEIAGAAPVPDWVFLLGRVGGLALAVATLQAVVVLATLAVQLRLGFPAIDPWLHLRLVFGLQLADHLLFAALAVAVHVAVAHKYVGYLAVLGAYAFPLAAPRLLGLEHRMLVFAADPGWSYFAMRGFGGSVGPWLTLELYWAAWTALVLVGASLLWIRGREGSATERLRAARRRLTPRAIGAAACAAVLVLALGGFTFYNTNVLHEYRTAEQREAASAAYERLYGRHADAPQPLLAGVRVHAELYPARARATIRASYQLVNRAGVPIDTIHVATQPDVGTGPVTLDRAATLLVSDDAHGHRILRLAEPLQPGDTLRLDVAVHLGTRGFSNDGVDGLVPANGTHLRNDLLPAIGYQRGRELSGSAARRRHGLPPRPRIPSLDDPAARRDVARAGAEQIMLETVVGTDAGQRAVAPGTLRRSWTAGGRRYFAYATDRPILNDWALFSADYASRAARWRDVDVEVLHHPGHAWNADLMLASLRASLEHLSTALGPYPHRQLRLVERPGEGGAHAYPINISFEEGVALLDTSRDPRGLDFPFAVVAHEAAHQWWGLQLTPAGAEGAPLLVESLAWYSAMGVVEHARGRDAMERLAAFMREAWLPPRAPADPPLLRATGWFLGYRKGPLALYALREYVGADRVDLALRRLLAANPPGRPPLPTTRDLYRELEAVTPDSVRPLLHDLFAANTLWELATERVTAAPAAGGMVQLTLDVRARKIVVDTTGAEREVPMHDLIEVGAFADSAKGERGAPLYRRLHRIRSGVQRITITVPAAARWAGVDPRSLLFDLKAENNVARRPREE